MDASGKPELKPHAGGRLPPRTFPPRQIPPCADGSTGHRERIVARDGRLVGVCQKCGLERRYRKKAEPFDLHDYVIRDRVREGTDG